MKKDKMNEEYRFKYEKLKIHMGYWIFILSMLSITFFTLRAHSSKSLSSEIAFGATLSGIILSVIAIIMTIIGETKSENTKDTLVNISTDLEEIVESIKCATGKLEDVMIFKDNIKDIQEDLRRISKGFDIEKSSISDEEKEDILKIDYISVYNLFLLELDAKSKKYITSVCYFLICGLNSKHKKSVINLRKIMQEYDSDFDSMHYATYLASAIVFAPIMKIKCEKNQFNEYIEENMKNDYESLKILIDEIMEV